MAFQQGYNNSKQLCIPLTLSSTYAIPLTAYSTDDILAHLSQTMLTIDCLPTRLQIDLLYYVGEDDGIQSEITKKGGKMFFNNQPNTWPIEEHRLKLEKPNVNWFSYCEQSQNIDRTSESKGRGEGLIVEGKGKRTEGEKENKERIKKGGEAAIGQ